MSSPAQIAIDRLEWLQSGARDGGVGPYLSVDPAPASAVKTVPDLRARLLDQTRPLFKRYRCGATLGWRADWGRAMFALRNIGGEAAVQALVDGLDDPSALFRHEIGTLCCASCMR